MMDKDKELDSRKDKPPIRLAIIGLGGFAGRHHRALLALEERAESVLVCTCDPQPDAFIDERHELQFERRKVAVYDHYLAMLDAHQHELDAVVIPTPIQLHCEMHRECVTRGLKVYLEKPPTLDYRELEAMIAEESESPYKTQVGFNFIVQPERQALKQRLLDGEFGDVTDIRLFGMWPRPREYFTRSLWAGRLKVKDQLVLDSVIGNAMAHFVHNSLFWGGSSALFDWATIASLEAKIYRGHAIEGGDTFFIRAEAANGIRFRIALSHACNAISTPHEQIVTENAELHVEVRGNLAVRWKDGRTESIDPQPVELLIENHLAFYAHCRNPLSRPTTTLSDCRPFVHLNDLAYISSGAIHRCAVEESVDESGRQWVNIEGMVDAAKQFLVDGAFPSKACHQWADDHPPRIVSPADLHLLPNTIDLILSADGA